MNTTNSVIVRKLKIGAGIPKICIANIGKTKAEIIQLAKQYVDIHMDFMEWRADWFDHVADQDAVLNILEALREILVDVPLLFTFRTTKEGGNTACSPREYQALNILAARSGYADLIDVEIFTGNHIVESMIDAVHDVGVKVIASNHDFDKTPEKADLIYRLRKMDDYGADILKLAVMPQTVRDVLTLLDATQEVKSYTAKPIITMSMSGLGGISRLAGEVFGSAVTFGAGIASSAPGQIKTAELYQALQIIHNIVS